MRYKVKTWEELAYFNGIVWLHCEGCRNRRVLHAADICLRQDPHGMIKYARFRCNRCDGRRVKAFPYIAGFAA